LHKAIRWWLAQAFSTSLATLSTDREFSVTLNMHQ
jgi:hypothetical protein